MESLQSLVGAYRMAKIVSIVPLLPSARADRTGDLAQSILELIDALVEFLDVIGADDPSGGGLSAPEDWGGLTGRIRQTL